MKYSGGIAICLASGLVLQTNVHALTPEVTPYTAIVKQNVFRLKSPPPVAQLKPVVPPPRIILLGIVSGHGPKQVMLKTLEGTPPKETSYALGEKEFVGEIEVIEIVEAAGLVRVRNHGRQQTLSLEKDGMKPGSSSSAAARPSPIGDTRLAGSNQHRKPDISAEEQMILMEVNRKLTAGQVEKGQLPPLPPTAMTGN